MCVAERQHHDVKNVWQNAENVTQNKFKIKFFSRSIGISPCRILTRPPVAKQYQLVRFTHARRMWKNVTNFTPKLFSADAGMFSARLLFSFSTKTNIGYGETK